MLIRLKPKFLKYPHYTIFRYLGRVFETIIIYDLADNASDFGNRAGVSRSWVRAKNKALRKGKTLLFLFGIFSI